MNDFLNLRTDKVLQGLMQSSSSDTSPAEILFSSDCAMLSFDYTRMALQRESKLVVIVSSLALYLFPPRLKVDSPNGQPSMHLVTNSYDIFPLFEIMAISVPFTEQDTENGQSVALRTNDCCIHMHDAKSLWLRIGADRRSDFVQSVADAYDVLFNRKVPLFVDQMEYKALLQFVAQFKVSDLVDSQRDAQFCKLPPAKSGWMYVHIVKGTLVTHQTKKWVVVLLNDIWFFKSEAEAEVFRFALRTPVNSRASLPTVSRILIKRRMRVGRSGLRKLEVQDLESDLSYIFYVVHKNELAQSWIDAILSRLTLIQSQC